MIRNIRTWKRLAKLAKHARKHLPKRVGMFVVDYVTSLYDKWGLVG